MSKGGLAKQLQQCLRNLDRFTDGQVQMVECDWENLEHLTLEISPNAGLYQGGRYKFKIEFNESYPTYAPTLICLTTIFHPNIDLESNGGGVCVSLIDDWTPSNTLEDVIMSLLFLLYNPNIEDPLSELFTSDMSPSDYEQRQKDVMRGEIDTLVEDFDKSRDDLNFLAAKEQYEGLQQVEWDVLAEAAKAEWSYKLEQENWQKEMEKYEQEVNEKKEKQIKLNHERFECSNINTAAETLPQPQRIDYAFGKPSLQRFTTVTAPCGQANTLGFGAPNKSMVLSWQCAGRFGIHNNTNVAENTIKEEDNKKEEEREEEDMDCTPPPPSNPTPTPPPSNPTPTPSMPQDSFSDQPTPFCFSWRPFCQTDRFVKPALHRTVTC